MAYGYRDTAYFFLKVRAALPGNVPCTKKNRPLRFRTRSRLRYPSSHSNK